MKQYPKVSIIIVNWNGREHLRYSLPSLSKIDYPNYEIILVDNNSTDSSLEFVRNNYPQIKIIKNTANLGFAQGNNLGIRQAAGKYVLFLNNDTKVKPDFLTKLVSGLESEPDIGAVQSKILLMDRPKFLDSIGSFLTWTGFLTHFGFLKKNEPRLNKKIEIFSAMGVCLLVRRDVLEKVGFFDKDFFAYFEETDLCWRIWLAGYKILYISEAVIYHKKGATSSLLPNSFITYHSFKNRICSLIKNLELKNLMWMLPIHLVICKLVALGYFLKGKPRNSLSIFRALGWNLVNFKSTLTKRKTVQNKIRKISDSLLLPRISRKISLTNYWQLWQEINI